MSGECARDLSFLKIIAVGAVDRAAKVLTLISTLTGEQA